MKTFSLEFVQSNWTLEINETLREENRKDKVFSKWSDVDIRVNVGGKLEKTWHAWEIENEGALFRKAT